MICWTSGILLLLRYYRCSCSYYYYDDDDDDDDCNESFFLVVVNNIYTIYDGACVIKRGGECVFFVVVFVFSCLGKEQTRKEFSPLSKSLLKGAYFFFLRKEEGRTFF